jgi:tetratricopeptide (TPR) repeat protein
MNATLNFIDRLVTQGRKLQQLGMTNEAASLWSRLAALQSLPPAVADEVQATLAEIHLNGGKYPRARRHLAVVLTQHPEDAQTHYLFACAHAEDDRGDRQLALSHFRRAMNLAPGEPAYLAAFGLLAIEQGERDNGLTALRSALELAPDDPEIVAQVADGLRQQNVEEARAVARAALFRNPRDGRFRKVWNDLQFSCLRAEQVSRRRTQPLDEEPILLPFIRPRSKTKSHRAGRAVRRDRPSRPSRPHYLPGRVDKKHA